ncbi:MAG: hypothetical protein H8D80_02275 [Proteobacteria bacterium]|nr:hypothetical protein [Pseudomonadota bacterium]
MMKTGQIDFITEQGPPPGMPGMPGMGGPPAPPPPDLGQMFFDEFRKYPKIDTFVQQMQMEGWADSVILDSMWEKFWPELIYMSRKILAQAAKPPPPPGGMPGMPPAPGM